MCSGSVVLSPTGFGSTTTEVSTMWPGAARLHADAHVIGTFNAQVGAAISPRPAITITALKGRSSRRWRRRRRRPATAAGSRMSAATPERVIPFRGDHLVEGASLQWRVLCLSLR